MSAILFTDIESSTRLWEEHADAMPAALARHDEILRQVVTDHQGKVLKTTGDGLIAVFPGPAAAVGAALDGQRALISEPWPETGPLRARMAIHVGDALARDDDLFGPVMNRAARIMSAGHGGQVLLSAAAATPDDDLPGGVALRDLGEHRLKDLTQPEHLWQLLHPDLASDFPALATLDTRPHNLPLQTTEFLGRQSELSAIAVMLDSPGTRLLTLAGPGGAGKTRLALQVAADRLDRYQDGVFFVDLAAERDPAAAFEAIVRALDLTGSGPGDSLQTLKTRLRDKETLLVLDNLEQVTAVGPGLGELLQHAAKVDILTTSRETLRVRAERVFPVPPMSLPRPTDSTELIAESEAIQLFAERARSVRPDFTVDDDNAATIAEICLRLDGLPLAIELAAARLKLFTPQDLLERLRDRLDVLGAGGRDLPDRQRTLWAAIGWSYELLEERERKALEMMSVFSSARLSSLEAVSKSALGAMDVIDLLESLVDKSLVRSDDDGISSRFGMLLMIKEYARERLAEDPELEERVRHAHATHYSEFVTSLEGRIHGQDRQSAIDDLAVEIGNLRTTWGYWVSKGEAEQLFSMLDGLWALHEAKGWYHAAIELARDTLGVLAVAADETDRLEEELTLRTSLARALMAVRGYDREVEEAFEQALEVSERAGSATQVFPVLKALATYHMSVVDPGKTIDVANRMFALADQERSDAIRAEALYVHGAATAFWDDTASGLAELEQAIELYDPQMHGANRFRLGPNTAVVARVAVGLLKWERGELVESIDRVTDALDLARRLDHPYSISYALYHNGFAALIRGRIADCLTCARELRAVATENDYAIWATLSTVLEGAALTAMGEVEKGLELTEHGVRLYEGLTPPPIFWPLILTLRAQVHLMAQKPEKALELIDGAIGLMEGEKVTPPQQGILKGDILRDMSDLDGAIAAYEAAVEAAHSEGMLLWELVAWTRLVALRRAIGITPDGSEDLATTLEHFPSDLEELPLVEARSLLEGV